MLKQFFYSLEHYKLTVEQLSKKFYENGVKRLRDSGSFGLINFWLKVFHTIYGTCSNYILGK